MSVTVMQGDSREVLSYLPDASIGAVVTDPPYALVSAPGGSAGFMGKRWDTGETAFDPAFWREVLRVLKPGGHVVAASGTRTYHRLACAVEDAGFEIRDMVSWLYGSGFPKSHDVSKGIDKAAGAEREVVSASPAVKRMIPGADQNKAGWEKTDGREFVPTVTRPATPEAAAWEGWGTALKPACEPWVLARKPLIGTVTVNVLAHGTGALNVDGCRVEGEVPSTTQGQASSAGTIYGADQRELREFKPHTAGRWPANVVHDGSDEVVGALGESARFFYRAKASKHDRAGSKHPTVKPVALMQWLARLVTPPGGTVLDPFAGSGTTGVACELEGFDCVLIEREDEYVADILRRFPPG